VVDEEMLALHERERERTGVALANLRELAHDYDPAGRAARQPAPADDHVGLLQRTGRLA
jgi:hypothetical protein